jgi:hypothetical protein
LSSKSTIEQLFSVLEQGAFQGEWDDASQKLLLEATGMNSSDWKETLRSPYHRRYQRLCAVASILTSRNIAPAEYGPVKEYLRLYPSARRHAPSRLLKMLESAE